MITGLGSAKDLASGKRGAFYNTLEEFHKYWERIDIISPYVIGPISMLFENVYIHTSKWSHKSPLFWIWFIRKALEINKEQKLDLITVQDYPPFYNGYLAWKLWQKTGVPYISEIHHIPGYPKITRANPKETIREWFYSRLLFWRYWWNLFGSKASMVRVVNQKQTPEFLKKAGVPGNKIVYIPSVYIDLDIFKPVDSKKEYDLIFVGRMESNKGVNLFLTVVEKLNCKAVMVGDGSLFSKIRKIIGDLNLDVKLTGRVDGSKEIAEFMNKSKLLVMPSYNEGGPRIVLEAMACGVPVLATNVGLIPDFADKNAVNPALAHKSGVKIIDWDTEDIVNKTKDLLENKDEMKRLVTAGIEIARQFEKKAMIKNYADQLKEFIISIQK